MINRLTEQGDIKTIYQNFLGKSGILILYAKTGVGKSALTDEIFSKKIGSSFVRVPITQQQAEQAKGFYLSCLAKALNGYAEETRDFASLGEFVDTIYEMDASGEKIVNDFLDIVALVINRKELLDKLNEPKKFKEELVKKILESDNDIAISVLTDYIIYISRKSRIILSIENIQQAGNQLILFLNELLRKTENLFLVGEFTVDKAEIEVASIFKQFPYDRIKTYELNKLNKQELLGGIHQVVDAANVNEVRQIIEDSYDESSGNLANLQFFINKATALKSDLKGNLSVIKYDDALHSQYQQLTNSQKLILWFITTHWGRVYIRVLKELLAEYHSELTVSEILIRLQEFNFIRINNEQVSLVHDSQIDLLKNEEDSLKFVLLTSSQWLNFYREISIRSGFGNKDTNLFNSQELLIIQLHFIISIGGNANLDWMNVVLSEISKLSSGSLGRTLVDKVVSIFYQVVATNENKRLVYKTYEWILIILSKLGRWEEIRNIISKHPPSDLSDLGNLIQATARVATCDPSIKNDLELMSDPNNDFLYTGSQLLLLRYHRTFSNIKKAKEIWHKLLSQNKKNPYEFIITDQVNLCSMNFKKRQKLLELAKEGHLINGNIYQYCSTLLNINANSYYLHFSKLMSKRKYLRIAAENLGIAKEIMGQTHYPLHVYTNQKSIFQIVENETPPEIILGNLQNAYINCGITGNRPLIGSNILAVGLKYKLLDNLDMYADELMKMSNKYSDLKSEFSKYPLINCYNYYSRVKNQAGQKEVLRLYRKNSSLNDISDYIMATPLLNKLSLRLVKYYPCNIANWDIDFETIQKSF